MLMLEKAETCPNGCGSLEWAYDAQRCLLCGYDALTPHSCEKVTQEARLQNDRDWRAKLDHLKTENGKLRELLQQARREYVAFGILSRERLVQMDRAGHEAE